MSAWPCFSDGAVPLWVLAGGAAGMLAGWHNTLAHLPSHLPLPDEWKPQSVLQNLHPAAGNTHTSHCDVIRYMFVMYRVNSCFLIRDWLWWCLSFKFLCQLIKYWRQIHFPWQPGGSFDINLQIKIKFGILRFSFLCSLLQDKKSAYPSVMLFEIVLKGRKPG